MATEITCPHCGHRLGKLDTAPSYDDYDDGWVYEEDKAPEPSRREPQWRRVDIDEWVEGGSDSGN